MPLHSPSYTKEIRKYLEQTVNENNMRCVEQIKQYPGGSYQKERPVSEKI